MKNLIPNYGNPVQDTQDSKLTWLRSAPGCKRIVVDSQYLDSLNRPNVSLNWDAIEAIVEGGIKLKTGVIIPLDVIIFGTGYSLVCILVNHKFLTTHCSSFVKKPLSLNVRGSSGNTIREYFESKGGAQAYLGSCFPGFPNLFTILGKLYLFFSEPIEQFNTFSCRTQCCIWSCLCDI